MVFWILFIIELLVLFLTSKIIYQTIYLLSFKFLRNNNAAVIPVFLLFLPGVVIHELAHFLAAELLFVKTGELEISPKIENGTLKMGSIQIRETDMLRRAIIGVAPVIVGTTLLLIAVFYFVNNINLNVFSYIEILKAVLFVWIIFFITNTMFSSSRDVEGALETLAFLGFLALVLGISLTILKINFAGSLLNLVLSEQVVNELKRGSYFLLFPVTINIAIVLLSAIFRKRVI